ncbi:MAG TPA: elongation factor G [Holophagaceae bacterium]|nr:elongation factor G [Holophagaceae bacterium]
MTGKPPSAPRVAALVGPYLSGKTTLLESLLAHCGAIPKKGSIKDKSTVGDASPEARARQMSLELNAASATFLGESWTFLDCPGSVEFGSDTLAALMVADVAVVVCEPDPGKAAVAAPILRFLDEKRIPHLIFLNKMDNGGGARLRDTVSALQAVSSRPLVLRELPIHDGDTITGFVDLVSERAYKLGPGGTADLMPLPESVLPEEHEARREMLEHLADFDDHLLEELLEEVSPSQEEVFEDFRKELADDLIVPVLFGSADKDFGVRRLFKALRHETPEPTVTAKRLGIPEGKESLAQVFKTVHAAHVGKLSFSRIWRGTFSDGSSADGGRISGLYRPFGAAQNKVSQAVAGEIVALGRLESVHTGQGVTPSGTADLGWPDAAQPVAVLAMRTAKSGDEVKLGGALQKLCEEDPTLHVEQHEVTHERLLWGQGEIHLKTALDRLKNRFGLEVSVEAPLVPYKETIRKPVAQHGRFKHQSGGHGAFGDVHLEIKPLLRGSGFVFEERIVGGVIPRQFFPSVEKGCIEYMKQGPLGFPVVDLHVALVHGSFHSVDSSDAAFQQAARIAMSEGLPQANPVLLEPILELQISVPSEHTAKAQRLVTGRRGGQILGFNAKEGWEGWDVVSAYLPQAEMRDLIVELRSLTMGVGFFTWRFDRLQELEGRDADKVVETRKSALAKTH